MKYAQCTYISRGYRRRARVTPAVRRASLLVVLLLTACGGAAAPTAAGTYVMGDATTARQKATEPSVDPLGDVTLGELAARAEAGETFTFGGSTDIVLELHGDGRFDYYGPVRMGDDPSHARGRWTQSNATIELRFEPPVRSKDETVAVLYCRYEEGAVRYPMGRDPRRQVYYRLVEARAGAG
jgi:hypothetical protein